MNRRHAAVRFELSWESDSGPAHRVPVCGACEFLAGHLPPGMEGLAKSEPGQRFEAAVAARGVQHPAR
jgi:hypothetical protein